MRKKNKFSALTAGSMAIALLLGTSLAQAEELVCTVDNTVTGIKGLDVITSQFDAITIDVDFIYTTGYTIYGSNLVNLPFDGANSEEDAGEVYFAINQTLSDQPTIPDFAGQDGKNVYYIGAEVESEASGVGATAGWAGANYSDEKWEPCEFDRTDNCTGAGTMILGGSEYFVYADLTPAVSGATCDGSSGPPESDFTITPGITGSWYDVTRSGEGFNFEIIGSTLAPDMLAYFYTYDLSGNLMWISGVGTVSGDTVVVPMTLTAGTVFGDGFDPDDVTRDDWGTVTFEFSSCSAGTAAYTSPAFGSGSFNIERITSVAGATCP
jgi:hypothetical protein